MGSESGKGQRRRRQIETEGNKEGRNPAEVRLNF